MNSLILKLILTPLLIGTASLAGRRWGPAVSGWLVGLPFTSGPIAFFVALNQGAAFATAVAIGTLAGTISQVTFCLLYSRLAGRYGWPRSLAAGCLGFAAATAILQQLKLPLVPLFLLVILVLALALRLVPRQAAIAPARANPPHWDLPTRMVLATALVLLLTGSAPLLGAQLTGLLAPFPLYGAILAVFAQQLHGAVSAVRVLRGLLMGLFGFAGFFLVLAALLEPAGIAPAFGAAGAVALLIQAGALWALRRGVG